MPIIVVGLVLAVPIIVVGLVLIVLPVAPARANEFAPTGSYKHLLEQALFEGFGLLNLLAHGTKMGHSNHRRAAVSTTVVGANSFALPVAPANANEFAPTGSYEHLLQ